MAENRNELVLAQNQHAFIQDETKGIVQVIVGPAKQGLTGTDRPVKYANGKYTNVDLSAAISQNPEVAEGSYILLENPAEDRGKNPVNGQSQLPVALKVGRKVNIPGPTAFALWPGQVATIIQGHQLKSNQYIVVRVYNAEEALANWPNELKNKPASLVTGQLIVVKGTEVSFFIPPTGFEVLPDPITKNQFIREAVTLERLEYCILLDENGNKRYERGPQVVFPYATEKFVTKKDKNSATEQGNTSENPNDRTTTVKFKATELNDQMGIYVKVIADYQEDVNHVGFKAGENIGRPVHNQTESAQEGKQSKRQATQPVMYEYKVGDELFITGKVQRIYYPRPEHAIIEYGGEDGKFRRQRYYGIAIPKGEARYVLDKNTGKVEMVRGETIFLPDPRFQVIVRRVLDQRTVSLWYPGNTEALDYNRSLEALTEGSANYVQDSSFSAAMDLARSVNRGTRGSTALVGSGGGGAAAAASAGTATWGDTVQRGIQYTPPPSLTLNTKYDGPPTISVYTGYAVQVVNKEGERRVEKGPCTILLQYDETLEKLTLSKGNPKTTDNLMQDVYLRVDHNKVSDTISVETKDMVLAQIKVSYRLNFKEENKDKWFAVENYVKFMTDHCRSLVRSAVKRYSIKELIDNSSTIVRDTILDIHKEEGKARTGRFFVENGMHIYDIEVLKTSIENEVVSRMIEDSQQKAVQDTLILTARQRELDSSKLIAEIDRSIAQLKTDTELKKIDLKQQEQTASHGSVLLNIEQEAIRATRSLESDLNDEKIRSTIHMEEVARTSQTHAVNAAWMEKETKAFLDRMSSVNPKLVEALQAIANKGLMAEVMSAIAPLAITEQQGIGVVLERLFSNTAFAGSIKKLVEGDSKN